MCVVKVCQDQNGQSQVETFSHFIFSYSLLSSPTCEVAKEKVMPCWVLYGVGSEFHEKKSCVKPFLSVIF